MWIFFFCIFFHSMIFVFIITQTPVWRKEKKKVRFTYPYNMWFNFDFYLCVPSSLRIVLFFPSFFPFFFSIHSPLMLFHSFLLSSYAMCTWMRCCCALNASEHSYIYEWKIRGASSFNVYSMHCTEQYVHRNERSKKRTTIK